MHHQNVSSVSSEVNAMDGVCDLPLNTLCTVTPKSLRPVTYKVYIHQLKSIACFLGLQFMVVGMLRFVSNLQEYSQEHSEQFFSPYLDSTITLTTVSTKLIQNAKMHNRRNAQHKYLYRNSIHNKCTTLIYLSSQAQKTVLLVSSLF